MNKKIGICIFLCGIFLSLAFSGDFALINGPNHVYALMIPEGWILNKMLAQKMPLPVPFFIHPREELEVKSYIYSYGYESGEQSLKDYIDTANERLQKSIPSINIISKGQVKTKNGTVANIYHYKNYPDGHVEDVAYIKGKNIICVTAFSTRDMKAYNKRYEEFKKTVESFFYITDSPKSMGK